VVVEHLCVIRGGGDLATGVAWRLWRSGFPVMVTELAAPLTVRRTVALSSAIDDGEVSVEGMIGRRVDSLDEAQALALSRVTVPVVISPHRDAAAGASVVVDARLAKRNIDTTIDDAPLVIALGPGFTAAVDCHAVVETMRGPRLGRALWTGTAAANTATPGAVGGRSAERVLRAPTAGEARWQVAIGDRVTEGQALGSIDDGSIGDALELTAPFDGVVRGLIRDETNVPAGTKVGDIDPRFDVNCHEISDKALAVGGGVLEAVMTWLVGRAEPMPAPEWRS